MTFSPGHEAVLRRNLALAADAVHPSPDGLDQIRATTRPRTRKPRLIFRRFTARSRRNAVTIQPFDHNDPTTLPLQLVPTDVITRDPDTGQTGDWTFLRARDLGLRVLLECMTPSGRDVEFTVDRSTAIHVRPRGGADNFWGAA